MALPWNFVYREIYGQKLPNNIMDSNFRLFEWIYGYIEGVYLQAVLAANIYDSIAEGLAQTPDGGFFYSIDPMNNAFLVLWKNNAGVAQQISAYPSYETIQNAINQLQYVFETDGTIESINWNTITTAGVYKSLVDGNAPNGPGAGQLYYVLTFKHENDVLFQIAMPYAAHANEGSIKFRTFISNIWSDWRIILSSNSMALTQTAVDIELQKFSVCVPTAAGITLTLPQQPVEYDVVAVSPLGLDTIVTPGALYNFKGLALGESLRLNIDARIIEFHFIFNAWYVK